MLIKKPVDIKASEITDEKHYLSRRRFIKESTKLSLTGAILTTTTGQLLWPGQEAHAALTIGDIKTSPYSTKEEITKFEYAASYNNFYEFGSDKGDPFRNASKFKPFPWSVEISGECDKPGVYQLEDFIKPYQLEERIYRMRCVEGWSMVIPWLGIPLGDILRRFEPNSNAKYVAFTTVLRPEEMPGQRTRSLRWPYVEGLRIDEAIHPLTILSTGMYGRLLPNQNGAPLRLVVPWKYGFKGIKSIVKIEFTKKEPLTSWKHANSKEYGFYSNVNPKVSHPRWSQKKERRIPSLIKNTKTSMFNGYEDQVASLYSGMNLKRNY